MDKWTVVTNGSTYRLMNESGEFYSKLCTVWCVTVSIPEEFSTYDEAEKKRKAITWLPVYEY